MSPPDIVVGGRARGAVIAKVTAVALVALWAGMALDNTWLSLVTVAIIAAIGATGLNLVMGHTGLVSIGNAAFMGLGALTAAQIGIYLEWPFLVSILAGGVVGAVGGLAVALPSLRIKGLYLAMATLAFHFIAVWLIKVVQRRQVGSSSYLMPDATVGPIEVVTPHAWYVVSIVALAIVIALTDTLLSRKPGRCWHMIREEQSVAAASGVSVWRYKVSAFVLSSAIIGVGGGIYAYYTGVVGAEGFTLRMALEHLSIVIIGGLGSRWGAVAGALFVTTLPKLVTDISSDLGLSGLVEGSNVFLIQGALVGVALVAVIVLEPKGLTGMFTRLAKGTNVLVARALRMRSRTRLATGV